MRVKVDVRSSFYDGPNRMVVAEIRGTIRPDERIVMVAHIQEPGKTRRRERCGTLLSLAIAAESDRGEGAAAAGTYADVHLG
jgi:hypothetical protein